MGSRSKMTIRDAKLELSKLGMILSKTDYGEYRVNFRKGSEETAYYTNDLDDAIETARSMKKQQPQSNRLTSSKAVIRFDRGASRRRVAQGSAMRNWIDSLERKYPDLKHLIPQLMEKHHDIHVVDEMLEKKRMQMQKHLRGVPPPGELARGASTLKSSKAVDRVSTQLERLRTEMPREAGRLRDVILRLDRVANTLEAEESVSERVSGIESELEGLGVDFTVEPNSSHKEATCIYAYRGQLDPREEPSILGRVAKKYGSFFENTAQNQPYKIMIPHN